MRTFGYDFTFNKKNAATLEELKVERLACVWSCHFNTFIHIKHSYQKMNLHLKIFVYESQASKVKVATVIQAIQF